MDKRVQYALAHDRTIDIITRGRKTGHLRRTEIWFHTLDGQVYITGTPGRRDWYANLLSAPRVHVSSQAEHNSRLARQSYADPGCRQPPGDPRRYSSEAWRHSGSRCVGRGQSPGRRGIPGCVSRSFVNNGVEV